ncbi:MAG: ATP-binding cassette domain-containing protein, partial [Kiritimatiellales bacterium]
MKILEAENIGLCSGRTVLLEAVSFQLSDGESMAVTGPSGSGKTTLGRIIAGLQSPGTGTLTIRDGLRRMMIQQQDHFFALAGHRSTYHGQRYENQGMENCPTVAEYV